MKTMLDSATPPTSIPALPQRFAGYADGFQPDNPARPRNPKEKQHDEMLRKRKERLEREDAERKRKETRTR